MPPLARPLRPLLLLLRLQPPKRLASSHTPHDPTPHTEPFGRSFYLLLALFPTSYLVYQLSRPAADGASNPLTALLAKSSDYHDRWAQRNALHTRMMEQAGHDEALFRHTPSPNWHDLRMPEMIAAGSPLAIPAGHYANLEGLMEHYRARNRREEEKKLRRLQERKSAGGT